MTRYYFNPIIEAENDEDAKKAVRAYLDNPNYALSTLTATQRLELIDDTLEYRVNTAKEELAEAWRDICENNPDADMDKLDDIARDRLWEIADSNTPIYYSEIDDLFYLYGDMLEEAYDDAGLGDGKEQNYKQVTICVYIEQKLYNELEKLKAEEEVKREAKPQA